jgi:hypothetical protein
MGKGTMLRNSTIFKVLLALFLLPFTLSGCNNNRVCRELSREEIRPFLKRITGIELSSKVKVEDLRAILFGYNGLEDLYVAFNTDQEGCLYILDVFGGKEVLRQEFPQDKNNPYSWDISIFDSVYNLQKKVSIALFDKNLLDRIKDDALEHANTGSYSEDAIAGYYLEFDAKSKLSSYRILVFKDLGIVYIFAEKLPEGTHSWR